MAVLKEPKTATEHFVGKRVVLGRDETCDIAVPSRLISRHHARIRKGVFGGYTIEDLGSTHGTYVNDERIKKPRRLQSGDVITLAKVPIRPEETPGAPSDDPRATSHGWGMHRRPARGELVRGETRIGAELIFEA